MDERLKAEIAANPARFDDQDAPEPDNGPAAKDRLAKALEKFDAMAAVRRAARSAK